METATTRESRHKTVRCTICRKSMRSNHLKRHMQTHKDLLSMSEDEVRDELRARHANEKLREQHHQKIRKIADQENVPIALCNDVLENNGFQTMQEEGMTINIPYDMIPPDFSIDKKALETDMIEDNQCYMEKIELGKEVNIILGKGVVNEQSLSRPRKEALDLYRKQQPLRDMMKVELRMWQQQLLTLIDTASERNVIWIQGKLGNEGKTWFQNYVASYYGHARVVRLDLKMKTANVLHALTKRPLSTTDIFLFNEPRAINNESCNYNILESIKDGIAVSSKYNNDIMTFKTPNVVMVFSNSIPEMKQLSRDRWRIFRITKEGLKQCEGRIWERQKQKQACHSNFGRGTKCDNSDKYYDE